MAGQTLLFVALAAVLTLAVLAFVLRPLWHAPGSRIALGGLFAGLALATFALYRLVGTPMALDPVVRESPRTLDAAIAQQEAQQDSATTQQGATTQQQSQAATATAQGLGRFARMSRACSLAFCSTSCTRRA